MPETPTLAIAGRAYSGLLRDMYKDERRSVGTIAMGIYYCELPQILPCAFP